MAVSQTVIMLNNYMNIRPTVTTHQLTKIADEYFGLVLNTDDVPVELNSYKDRNFLVYGTMRSRGNDLDLIYKKHNKFIIKIFNAAATSSKNWYEKVLQNILSVHESCSSYFKLPYPFKALSENEFLGECKISILEDAVYENCTLNNLIEKGLLDRNTGNITANHIVRVTAYIDGEVLNVEKMNAELAYNWGKSVALISEAMKDLPEPEINLRSNTIWNMEDIQDIIPDYINCIKNEYRKKVLTKILEDYYKLLPSLKGSLRRQWLHGDLSDQNILQNNSNVVGLLDFDEAFYSYRVFDIAIPLMYNTAMSTSDKIIENAKNMFRGYSSIVQLNEIEMIALYTTVLVRYVQSLAIGEYNYLYVDPGNDYLLNTKKAGWKSLDMLLSIGCDNFLKEISIHSPSLMVP